MSVTDPIVRLDPFGHLVYVVKRLAEILEARITSLESGGSGGGGIGAGGISHHDLEDLADGDDHPQYFLNPGRPGEDVSVNGNLYAKNVDSIGGVVSSSRVVAVGSDPSIIVNPSFTLFSQGDVLFNSTTASTSFTTGSLVVNGGVGIGQALNVAGDLSCAGSMAIGGALTTLGAITAANILCANAPVHPNDVVRLADMPIPLVHNVANGTWGETGSTTTMSATLYYDVSSNTVTLYQKAVYNVSTSANASLVFTPTVQIPQQSLPYSDSYFPVIISWAGNIQVMGVLVVSVSSSPAQILINPPGGAFFPSGLVTVFPFTITWPLSS